MSAFLQLPSELRVLLRLRARPHLAGVSGCLKRPISNGIPKAHNPSKPSCAPTASNDAPQRAVTHGIITDTGRQSRDKQVQLIPRDGSSASLGPRKKIEVPSRVLPKARLSEDVTLSPKERMQMEFLTRRQPRLQQQKKLFRDRLLIYHAGMDAESGIVFSKALTLFCLSVTTCIIAPAYYTYGDPWWKVLGILLVGIAPIAVLHWCTKSFVTWIYLPLPPYARQTAKTALEYAKNLPASAPLHISFKRLHAWTGTAEVHLADLAPAPGRFPPSTFRWAGRRVDHGPWYSPNPMSYYVRERTATHGQAGKDTIPGIWEHVYRKIMHMESDTMGKWKR